MAKIDETKIEVVNFHQAQWTVYYEGLIKFSINIMNTELQRREIEQWCKKTAIDFLVEENNGS